MFMRLLVDAARARAGSGCGGGCAGEAEDSGVLLGPVNPGRKASFGYGIRTGSADVKAAKLSGLCPGQSGAGVVGVSVQADASELLSKILERVGSEGAFEEPVKNGGIGYVFDCLADALGISTVADLQRAQDGVL